MLELISVSDTITMNIKLKGSMHANDASLFLLK